MDYMQDMGQPDVKLEGILKRHNNTRNRSAILASTDSLAFDVHVLDIIELEKEFGALELAILNAPKYMKTRMSWPKPIENYIYPKLINYAWNAHWLSHVPYCRFFDLAITYWVPLSGGDLSPKVDVAYHHLKEWEFAEVTPYTVSMLKIADQNTLAYKLHETTGIWSDDGVCIYNFTMHYVGTTVTYPYSAIGMACRPVMNWVAEELDSNFYIIPQSIHNLLIVRDSDIDEDGAKKIFMKSTVSIRFGSQLTTDSIYHFDRMLGLTLHKVSIPSI